MKTLIKVTAAAVVLALFAVGLLVGVRYWSAAPPQVSPAKTAEGKKKAAQASRNTHMSSSLFSAVSGLRNNQE